MSELKKLIEVSDKILDILNSNNLSGEKPFIDEECFGDYDPDSSPIAWEYYSEMYKEFKIENKKLGKKISNGVRRKVGTFRYKTDGETDIKQGEFKKYGLEPPRLILGKEIDLAGDCVFNFKKEMKDNKLMLKWEFCSRMHHSPYNFSLMPVQGNMNSSKANLDRTDRLLFAIQKFYENKKNYSNDLVEEYKNNTKNVKDIKEEISNLQEKGYKIMRSRWNSENEIWLYDFLCKIGNVENYAKIFYHLDSDNPIDKMLLETMLESGKHLVESAEDVENYMDLAIEYWNSQRDKYYCQKKKIEKEEEKSNAKEQNNETKS